MGLLHHKIRTDILSSYFLRLAMAACSSGRRISRSPRSPTTSYVERFVNRQFICDPLTTDPERRKQPGQITGLLKGIGAVLREIPDDPRGGQGEKQNHFRRRGRGACPILRWMFSQTACSHNISCRMLTPQSSSSIRPSASYRFPVSRSIPRHGLGTEIGSLE